MSVRLENDVCLEVFRDGEWQEMEHATLTIETTIETTNHDRRLILDDRVDVPGPWRIYVNGQMIARKGWE